MADIMMNLDDTLELDARIKEWSNPEDLVNITPENSGTEHNLEGMETSTAVFDPVDPGVFNIKINGQELSVKVRSPTDIPDSELYPSSIIHRWHLSGFSTTVEDDVSGNSGTNNGIKTESGNYTGGEAGKGDGSSYIQISGDNLTDFYSDFTVALTFDGYTGNSQQCQLIGSEWENETSNFGFEMSMETDDTIHLGSGGSKIGQITTEPMPTDGEKHRFVWVQNGTELENDSTFYLDNSTISFSNQSGWSDNRMGSVSGYHDMGFFAYLSSDGTVSEYWDNIIDEIVFYNSALTSTEVDKDYSNQPWS